MHSMQLVSATGSTSRIGPGMLLELGKGDTVNMEVYGKYFIPPGSSSATVGDLAAAVISAFGLVPGTEAAQAIEAFFPASGSHVFTNDPFDNNAPTAGLTYIFFNKSYGLEDASFDQISTSANENGTDKPHDKMTLDFVADQAGYVFVYVSNENDKIVNTYFDDLKVYLEQHPVIQTDDYYPFACPDECSEIGRMAIEPLAFQKSGAQKNDFLFQEQELQDELDLGWYQFKWRNHDPALGRFFNVDPLAEDYVYNSVYAFSENRVIDSRELEGLERQDVDDVGDGNNPPKYSKLIPTPSVSKKIDDGFNLLSESYSYDIKLVASLGLMAKGKLGPIQLQAEGNLISLEAGSSDDNYLSTNIKLLGVEGKTQFASAEAEGRAYFMSASADIRSEYEADVNTEFIDVNYSASAGNNGFEMNLDNSTNLGAGAKLGFVKGEASVNVGKLYNALSLLGEAASEYVNDTIDEWINW